MKKLTIKREIIHHIGIPVLLLPKQITWACHIQPVRKSFACTIKGGRHG